MNPRDVVARTIQGEVMEALRETLEEEGWDVEVHEASTLETVVRVKALANFPPRYFRVKVSEMI